MHESGHYLMSTFMHYCSQVLYGCTLNTDFLFNTSYWHAVDLRYKRNLFYRYASGVKWMH